MSMELEGLYIANRYHLGAFLSAPWLGVKYCVARTQAFVWVGVYMFRGKGVVNIGMYIIINACKQYYRPIDHWTRFTNHFLVNTM